MIKALKHLLKEIGKTIVDIFGLVIFVIFAILFGWIIVICYELDKRGEKK
jgi:hypothetical protein